MVLPIKTHYFKQEQLLATNFSFLKRFWKCCHKASNSLSLSLSLSHTHTHTAFPLIVGAYFGPLQCGQRNLCWVPFVYWYENLLNVYQKMPLDTIKIILTIQTLMFWKKNYWEWLIYFRRMLLSCNLGVTHWTSGYLIILGSLINIVF